MLIGKVPYGMRPRGFGQEQAEGKRRCWPWDLRHDRDEGYKAKKNETANRIGPSAWRRGLL
jgi:hypothetical protein